MPLTARRPLFYERLSVSLLGTHLPTLPTLLGPRYLPLTFTYPQEVHDELLSRTAPCIVLEFIGRRPYNLCAQDRGFVV